MISEDVAGRLENYKFEQARTALNRMFDRDSAVPEEDRALIHALAASFGNPGWFDGHLATIIDAAIRPLCAPHNDVSGGL